MISPIADIVCLQTAARGRVDPTFSKVGLDPKSQKAAGCPASRNGLTCGEHAFVKGHTLAQPAGTFSIDVCSDLKGRGGLVGAIQKG